MDKTDSGIFIVATPIGNLDDISFRAIEAIKNSDYVVCENPKHSLKLLNKLGIKKKLIPLHDYNESNVINRISNQLLNKKIALISDAGSPLISDPGFKLVQYCIENNINISSIPGACSIIPALQLSGIALNEFYFSGFFPKNKKSGLDFINQIKNLNKTSVFFVSNHKLKDCLILIETELNQRKISISKELTKINENTYRGFGHEMLAKIQKKQENLKGEFVVVVEAKKTTKIVNVDLEKYNYEISKLLLKFSLTDVVEIVHKLTGLTKNKVYKWVLKQKKG
tara:strand:+ start:3345 stop:4190 length:846 start_codon:yes stop_codon:yes gene_type:complete